MSHHTNDITELPKTPSVQVVVDSSGSEWTCWEGVDRKEDLSAQGCEPSDSVVYDRGFGG